MAVFLNDYKCLDCRKCFRKNELFRLLKDEELELVNENRMEVHFKQGEVIFKQGSPMTHMVILNEGMAKSYIEGLRDKNLILNIVRPFEINCGPGMYVDNRHHCSLMAISETDACFIDANAFKKVVRLNTKFAEEFIKYLSARTIDSFQRFITITQKNMEGRIADALLYLHKNVYENGSIKHLSKQDIADFTAMTRESAIRVMKEFKDEGLIDERDKEILLLNESTLNKYAELG
jgi:CRP/FNR family transcriptional regulator